MSTFQNNHPNVTLDIRGEASAFDLNGTDNGGYPESLPLGVDDLRHVVSFAPMNTQAPNRRWPSLQHQARAQFPW